MEMDDWVRSERYTTCLPTHCSPAEKKKRKRKCANYKIKTERNKKTKDKTKI